MKALKKKSKIIKIISWIMVLWIVKVFLTSIPYKFSQAPETQHIFGTIGDWMKNFLGEIIGQGFSDLGPYIIGSFEIIISVLLLFPIILSLKNICKIKPPCQRGLGGFFLGNKINLKSKNLNPNKIQALGGIGASIVMGGAIFFHLFTPLGIDIGDGGSLFYSAVSIFFFGIAVFFLNYKK